MQDPTTEILTELFQEIQENLNEEVPYYFREDLLGDYNLNVNVNSAREYREEEEEENDHGNSFNNPTVAATSSSLPEFHPIDQERSGSHHTAYVHSLPESVKLDCSALSFFKLFFPDSILKKIVNNTNAYAISKKAGENGREWEPLTILELLSFLAFLIYRGMFQIARFSDYWNKDDTIMPVHSKVHLTWIRAEEIKRYLHISHHADEVKAYYDKVQPLMGHIQKVSKAYYVPKTNVSVDEMTVRFWGRSAHTFRIKNKPTPVGYKILALCDSGYTVAFLPESRVQKNIEIEDMYFASEEGQSLNTISKKVVWLVQQIPHLDRGNKYNIFMDN